MIFQVQNIPNSPDVKLPKPTNHPHNFFSFSSTNLLITSSCISGLSLDLGQLCYIPLFFLLHYFWWILLYEEIVNIFEEHLFVLVCIILSSLNKMVPNKSMIIWFRVLIFVVFHLIDCIFGKQISIPFP